MSKVYHGILLDVEFEDTNFLNTFTIFAKRKSTQNEWMLYGVIVEENKIDETVKAVQENLRSNKPYYAHFYKDDKLIIVFKKKIFVTSIDKTTWTEAIEYGLNLGIPREQLDFKPSRFQDEDAYFSN